ncbi:hypothetical protein [Reichenbachiella versicolor]|uniref:hypothetical protein n=1 Tax=Reichenbachiella versicolor TaxID=1821036 RepID=UPI000D6E3015|nr:hypothetical protein [Reichenbachiella versicolor]
MKTLLTIFIILTTLFCSFAQGDSNTRRVKYRLPRSYDSIYVKAKKSIIRPKGALVTKTSGGYTWQEKLEKTDTIKVDFYKKIKMNHVWYFDEVKYDDKTIEWVRLNPRKFKTIKNGVEIRKTKEKNASHPTQEEMRLKIDPNKFVRLNIRYFSIDILTLPFVYRPALNDTIGSQLSTNLSLGVSTTYNFGREYFRNRRLTAKRSITSFSSGLGFGFKKIDLDKSSTSLSDKPIMNEEDGLAFFLSPGIGFHTRGLTFTLMYGWDLPITENVKDWNYANEGYIAFGFGLGIDSIGKVLKVN